MHNITSAELMMTRAMSDAIMNEFFATGVGGFSKMISAAGRAVKAAGTKTKALTTKALEKTKALTVEAAKHVHAASVAGLAHGKALIKKGVSHTVAAASAAHESVKVIHAALKNKQEVLQIENDKTGAKTRARAEKAYEDKLKSLETAERELRKAGGKPPGEEEP